MEKNRNEKNKYNQGHRKRKRLPGSIHPSTFERTFFHWIKVSKLQAKGIKIVSSTILVVLRVRPNKG